MIFSCMAGMSVTASAGDTSTYTITIPSTLTVENSGWNSIGNISASGTLEDGKKLNITATSLNNFALKSGDNSVTYTIKNASTDTKATTSWDFTKEQLTTGATQAIGIDVSDYSSKPAGTYQDTVTFTAMVKDNLFSFTIMRDVNSNSSGNYTVVPGTTWRQFIESGNAPASVTIGTWGNYSGKVCHDMDGGMSCCGGTLIANTADNRHVRIDEAIIDGATYACSDYLGYQDHD